MIVCSWQNHHHPAASCGTPVILHGGRPWRGRAAREQNGWGGGASPCYTFVSYYKLICGNFVTSSLQLSTIWEQEQVLWVPACGIQRSHFSCHSLIAYQSKHVRSKVTNWNWKFISLPNNACRELIAYQVSTFMILWHNCTATRYPPDNKHLNHFRHSPRIHVASKLVS